MSKEELVIALLANVGFLVVLWLLLELGSLVAKIFRRFW